MNHEVLRDCLTLDYWDSIPWLKNVHKLAVSLGRPELFTEPAKIAKGDLKWVKTTFKTKKDMEREALELSKRTVRTHQLIVNLGHEPELYLKVVNNANHRYLLTKFSLNKIHLLLSDRPCWTKQTELDICNCDGFSIMDTAHFLFFCGHFKSLRKKFIVPLLKEKRFKQVKPALLYLQLLSNTWEISNVATFFSIAMRLRKK